MVWKLWRFTTTPAKNHAVFLPGGCPGDLNLADMLTKHGTEATKIATLYLHRQSWVVKFDKEFVSARKQQKARRTAQKQQQGLQDQPLPEEDLDAYEATYYGLNHFFDDRAI